jgi:hypothetical protein
VGPNQTRGRYTRHGVYAQEGRRAPGEGVCSEVQINIGKICHGEVYVVKQSDKGCVRNNNDGIIIYYDTQTHLSTLNHTYVSPCVLLSTPHTSRSLYPLYAPLSPSCSIHRVRGKACTGYGDLPRRHRLTHHVQSGTVGFLMSDIFHMRPDHVVKESKVTHAQVGELASMLRILNHYTITMRSRGSCNYNHTRLLFSSPGFNATPCTVARSPINHRTHARAHTRGTWGPI